MNRAIYNQYQQTGGNAVKIDVHKVRSLALIGLASLIIAYLTSVKAFGIDRDYYNYILFYETVQGRISYSDLKFESGFVYLSWLFRNLIDFDFPAFVLVITTFSLSVKFWFLYKYTKFPILAIACYMLMFYPIHEYTQIRVSLALSFSILAIHFLVEKRFIKSALFFLIAPLFHITVVAIAMCALVYFIRKKYLGLAIVAMLGLLIWFAGDVIFSTILAVSINFNDLSAYYATNADYTEQANILSVNNLAIYFAIIFCLIRNWAVRSDLDYILFIILVASVASLVILIQLPVFSQRLKELLSVFMIPLIFRNYRGPIDMVGFVVLIGASAWAFFRYVDQSIIFV